MPSWMPRLDISLTSIRENARMLSNLYGQKGISLMGVSKAVLGEPAIAEAMIQGGVKYIADSRIENIKRMKQAGLKTQYVLLRTAFHQAEAVVKWVDISFNSELKTLRALSAQAQAQSKVHQVIIMVELGDLREGVMPCDLAQFITETLSLPYLKVMGLGCNLACFGGVKPNQANMKWLSELTDSLEEKFHIPLDLVSGGNSANYQWSQSVQDVGRINNLRIGESILLGCETLNRIDIPGLHTQAFQLVGEVIESKYKPSVPSGDICQDAFGNHPVFVDRGLRQRAIIALGRQDILVSSLKTHSSISVLGSSSDHLILDDLYQNLHVGDAVNFGLDYGGLLSAMTSPFISKNFV